MAGLTVDNPVSFETLVNTKRLLPGDVVKLAPGIYKPPADWSTRNWVLNSSIKGTAVAPIKFIPLNGPDTVVIDGGIHALGAYLEFYDLEVMVSDTIRETSNLGRPPGIIFDTPGSKAINCIVHDCGHPGIAPTGGNFKGEVSECIIYHCGIYDDVNTQHGEDWTRGSAVYAQSFGSADGENLLIENVTSFRNFTTGGKSYGSGVTGHTWKGLVSFDSQQDMVMSMNYVGVMDKMVFDDMLLFSISSGGRPRIGVTEIASGVVHQNITISNSYIVLNGSSFQFGYCDLPHLFNNYIFDRSGDNRAMDWTKRFIDPSASEIYNNKYFGEVYTGGVLRTADSGHWIMNESETLVRLPATNLVKIHANKYDANKARVSIVNWESVLYQDIDVGVLLSVGENYTVRDVQNYYGSPAVSGTYNGTSIRFPLDLTDVSVPIGNCPHLGTITNTAPLFACFIVTKA